MIEVVLVLHMNCPGASNIRLVLPTDIHYWIL
jgi:hypothetical protein